MLLMAGLYGLNAAGRSAAAVSLDAYRAQFGATMPTRGGWAALTAPGTVAGWWNAHVLSRDTLGSPVRWKALFDDAVIHAGQGFAVSPGQLRVTAQAAPLFNDEAPRKSNAPSGPSTIRTGSVADFSSYPLSPAR